MKRLIFRLSSLGDVVLSQSILEPPYSGETHWVVAKEFESLIAGSPSITRVWVFDKSQGRRLIHWMRFLRDLRAQNYTEVLDAHATLRTWIARIYFSFGSPSTKWKTLSKERLRRLGYVVAKKAWPISWRPTHQSKRCAQLAGGYGNERPNLRWLARAHAEKVAEGFSQPESDSAGPIVAIVPGSAWPGKEWPAEKYADWIVGFRGRFENARFIVLGAARDHAAQELKTLLQSKRLSFFDAVGRWNLPQVAAALSQCDLALGGDTGLLHLSEAVGTPVISLYGPTQPDFGFGVQDERSLAISPQIWCSPCSKDGTLCFRTTRRYACLRELDPRIVLAKSEKFRFRE